MEEKAMMRALLALDGRVGKLQAHIEALEKRLNELNGGVSILGRPRPVPIHPDSIGKTMAAGGPVDLGGLTFLIHYRKDSAERLQNLKTVYAFYKQAAVGSRFILIEDGVRTQIAGELGLGAEDAYLFLENPGVWNKCAAFNLGLSRAETEVVCFHDADAVVAPAQLALGVELLGADPAAALIYPYDGRFYNVSPQVKAAFGAALDLGELERHLPPERTVSTAEVAVLHTQSVGGSVLGRRDNLLKAKGYNPHFQGWGWEDYEMPERVAKLGYGVWRLAGEPLWHLPHEGPGASPREQSPYFRQNEAIYETVVRSSKEELERYITGWRVG